jgi:hypothetical protein
MFSLSNSLLLGAKFPVPAQLNSLIALSAIPGLLGQKAPSNGGFLCFGAFFVARLVGTSWKIPCYFSLAAPTMRPRYRDPLPRKRGQQPRGSRAQRAVSRHQARSHSGIMLESFSGDCLAPVAIVIQCLRITARPHPEDSPRSELACCARRPIETDARLMD